MFNEMETEIVFSGESETAFSETEMEAAEQLVQLSEEDTLSCSSGGTGWSVCGYDGSEGNDTKRQEDVVSSKVRDHIVGKEQNDGVCRNKNVTNGQSFMKTIMETKTRINKKKKFRSLASIYRATKEMTKVE
ncbi:unnamed protein product [Arabidopsis lyrata]|nr:uncharacterized protein LOC9302916 [Arabidopsis lyrata subsp. lyrata]CAH8273824.1 unnamed protein product [Arabidopsis lyrata]|eukprot:XP_020872779.1 uncharacterized protein LOC9302916 [Arabidopsis lyrata subsp. lyrata]